MLKQILKIANFYRIADAYSTLSREGFLKKQIQSKGLFTKLNPNNDRSLNNKIIMFVADLIDQIVFSYINKGQTDQINWFINGFKNQNKHLQDIMNYDIIETNNIINHSKNKPIENLNSFINDLGSCISVLENLKEFKKINNQLPKDQQIKLTDLNFSSLIEFVQLKKANLNQIITSGQPKTLEKINVPNITSYKVYKCYPPKDKSKWKECPQYIQLHEKFAKDAKWCVIQGQRIPYGHYLDPKWNFYVLVTTNSNKPVMFFNFAENSDGQIKDVHDGAFSAYNEQLFHIIDWFIETYKFNPSHSSDYKLYEKIKKVYNNSVDKDSQLKLLYESNNYTYYQGSKAQSNDYDYYYIYNNKNQCKFLIVNKYQFYGAIIRIGSKDKISEQIIDFIIQQKLRGVINHLIDKKIIQKQNGIVYIKAVKFMLQNGTEDQIYKYLENGVVDEIMTFREAVDKLQDGSKIKKLLIHGKVKNEDIEFCFDKILSINSIIQFSELLKDQQLKESVLKYIQPFKQPYNASYPHLDYFIIDKLGAYMLLDSTTHIMISYLNSKNFKMLQQSFIDEQVEFFIQNYNELKIEQSNLPLIFLKYLPYVQNNQQLSNKIDDQLEIGGYDYNNCIDEVIDASVDIEFAQNFINFQAQQNNYDFIQRFLDQYSGSYEYQLDCSAIYDCVQRSNDSDLIITFINSSLMSYDDNSYEMQETLIYKLGDLNACNKIYHNINWENDTYLCDICASVLIDKHDFDKAINLIDYLYDDDDIASTLRYYLETAKSINNTEAICELLLHLDNLDDLQESEQVNLQEYIDYLVQQQADVIDLLNNNKINKLIFQSICENGSNKMLQMLVDYYDNLESDQQDDLIDCLIKKDNIELISKIDIQNISSDFYDDIIEMCQRKNSYTYLIDLITQDEDYQYLKDQMYDNDNLLSLFQLGKYQKLDENKLKHNNEDIVLEFINTSYANGEPLFESVRQINEFSKNNTIKQNILFPIIKRVLQSFPQSKDLEKCILLSIKSKLLIPNDQLFQLLLNENKFFLLSQINDYKNKKDIIKEKSINNEDKSQLTLENYDSINFKDAIDIISDEQLSNYILKRYSSRTIFEQDMLYAIQNKYDVIIDLIIKKGLTIGRRKEVFLILKKCVDNNIDKNICKQLYEKYTQQLHTDLFKQMNSLWGQNYTQQQKNIINNFKNYMQDTIKLSKQLFNIVKLLR